MTRANYSKLLDTIRAQLPDPDTAVAELRLRQEEAGARALIPDGVSCSASLLDGLPVEVVAPHQASDGRTVLYLHAGGYVLGSPTAERALAARLALAVSGTVVGLHYRRAPEHACPAAVEDATTAYLALVASGTDPAQIVILGDSAGGGITVATLVALRDQGMPLPRAAVCLSPWVDLRLVSASMQNADVDADPEGQRWLLARFADYYLAGRPADDPIALSPLRRSARPSAATDPGRRGRSARRRRDRARRRGSGRRGRRHPGGVE